MAKRYYDECLEKQKLQPNLHAAASAPALLALGKMRLQEQAKGAIRVLLPYACMGAAAPPAPVLAGPAASCRAAHAPPGYVPPAVPPGRCREQ